MSTTFNPGGNTEVDLDDHGVPKSVPEYVKEHIESALKLIGEPKNRYQALTRTHLETAWLWHQHGRENPSN